MPNKPKVVSINEDGRKLVAECERSKRFILNLGRIVSRLIGP
jgi:hypothetical protein